MVGYEFGAELALLSTTIAPGGGDMRGHDVLVALPLLLVEVEVEIEEEVDEEVEDGADNEVDSELDEDVDEEVDEEVELMTSVVEVGEDVEEADNVVDEELDEDVDGELDEESVAEVNEELVTSVVAAEDEVEEEVDDEVDKKLDENVELVTSVALPVLLEEEDVLVAILALAVLDTDTVVEAPVLIQEQPLDILDGNPEQAVESRKRRRRGSRSISGAKRSSSRRRADHNTL
jgi:hypothetical protein